jgi:uroporphyrin-III C-methyltransferase/precorrin-2 dehydrogenase/sirohydrochlorin ferrochelatase
MTNCVVFSRENHWPQLNATFLRDAYRTVWRIEEPAQSDMNLLPIFLKLDGRRCLLVGAGAVALDKIGSLLKTGLRLRVIAPEARPEILELHAAEKLEWTRRAFVPSDLDGIFLVVAATDSEVVNAEVYREAVKRGVLCNSVDDIPNCDFFFGSVVSRGELQIAISTAGESPAFAQRLRREIDEQLPEDLGPWLHNVGELRREVLSTLPRSDERKLLLHQLAHRQICELSSCPARKTALKPKGGDVGTSRMRTVCLVGAGPGDPDLLTVKALRLIQAADVILHDDLVPRSILEEASCHADIINVGKRCGSKVITQDQINDLMIEYVQRNLIVVRLKSGDPLIFGRAAEEIDALKHAQVTFEIVPGITAASAAAAAIGCSLTDRSRASNVIFSTGHHAQSHNQSALPHLEDATRVVYMPGRDLRLLAQEWLQEGLPPEFPCAIVSHAAQPDQKVLWTTLAALGDAEPTLAPSLLIAGWAVGKTSIERSITEAGVAIQAR